MDLPIISRRRCQLLAVERGGWHPSLLDDVTRREQGYRNRDISHHSLAKVLPVLTPWRTIISQCGYRLAILVSLARVGAANLLRDVRDRRRTLLGTLILICSIKEPQDGCAHLDRRPRR